MTRFMHTGDVHLGFRQYGSDERARDFARAFRQTCQTAIHERCDFMLICGDLFHNSGMDPRTFLQAVGALEPLREKGISVVAIAGNHDRARKSHGLNWLHALQELGYLSLLDSRIDAGVLTLGSSGIPHPDIRVVGIPYVGMALPQLIPQIAEQLAALPRKFTILMLHAGLEGELPGFRAALTTEALEVLHPHVDYLALGHIHKPYGRHGWVYNPGSLETVSIDEAQWPHRGGIMVEIEDGNAVDFEWAVPDRRAFVQLELGVDTFRDPEALYRFHAVTSKDHASLRAEEIGHKPIVELRLQGCLRFDRSALDLTRIENILEDAYDPLLIRIRDQTEAQGLDITVSENATRAEIERQVLTDLLSRDAGRKRHAQSWTTMLLEVMEMALRRSDPDGIIAPAQAFRRSLTRGLC